jgi:hypothetical protein
MQLKLTIEHGLSPNILDVTPQQITCWSTKTKPIGGEKTKMINKTHEEEEDFWGFDNPEETETDIEEYIWG